MIPNMSSSDHIFSEVQPYRELPPFTLLAVVGALFGWFLIIWVIILDRSLGALVVPDWLALVIGLTLGVLLPLVYVRMRMVTEIYPDRVLVKNGMTGHVIIPLIHVTNIELRTDNIREDYNVRNIGQSRTTRIAHTVSSDNGIQLTLTDGRQFLIGSKNPTALNDAVHSVWKSPELMMEPAGAED